MPQHSWKTGVVLGVSLKPKLKPLVLIKEPGAALTLLCEPCSDTHRRQSPLGSLQPFIWLAAQLGGSLHHFPPPFSLWRESTSKLSFCSNLLSEMFLFLY